MEFINATSGKKLLVLSWQDVENAVKMLVPSIPFKPSIVLGVARGGVVPASLIHRHLPQTKLDIVALRSRWKGEKITRSKVRVAPYDWKSLKGQKVLIVDDILDTGMSIDAIQARLPKDCSVCYMTIVTKQPRTHIISAYQSDPDTWVKFPWEAKGD